MGSKGSSHMNPINQVSNEMNKEQFENINKNNNIFYISIFIISIIIFISIIYLYKNRYKG
jgi:cell division protein FtsL